MSTWKVMSLGLAMVFCGCVADVGSEEAETVSEEALLGRALGPGGVTVRPFDPVPLGRALHPRRFSFRCEPTYNEEGVKFTSCGRFEDSGVSTLACPALDLPPGAIRLRTTDAFCGRILPVRTWQFGTQLVVEFKTCLRGTAQTCDEDHFADYFQGGPKPVVYTDDRHSDGTSSATPQVPRELTLLTPVGHAIACSDDTGRSCFRASATISPDELDVYVDLNP